MSTHLDPSTAGDARLSTMYTLLIQIALRERARAADVMLVDDAQAQPPAEAEE
jgi:hypothetical protein